MSQSIEKGKENYLKVLKRTFQNTSISNRPNEKISYFYCGYVKGVPFPMEGI